MNDPVTEAYARACYAIVVEECGASDDRRDADSFVFHATGGRWSEWRFCGSLGMGGKLWRPDPWEGGRPARVTCYPEDETPRMTAAMERANARLAEVDRG